MLPFFNYAAMQQFPGAFGQKSMALSSPGTRHVVTAKTICLPG